LVAVRVGVPVEMLHGAGESQIVAPDGTIVAMAPRTGEAVVVADIEVEAADDKRRPDGTDVMTSRRPDLYGPILDAPRGRQREAGADELLAAVVNPGEGDDVETLLGEAVATGAGLVVLPELAEVAPEVIVAALAGSTAYVATSVAEGDAHVGLVLSADGVVLRQQQLHASAQHPWATALGDSLAVVDLTWGCLALVVGDDALYPETFRLASLQDVDVVAVPFTTQAAADLDPLLLERAAENRLNVAVASRRGAYGGGALYPLSADFTLWAPDRGPFAGIISRPDPILATRAVEVAILRPACAVNRFVSKGTDLVDGRPWELAQVLVGA
jgi:predicted amidohydrolase